ncbi:MAG: NPCBM/NEW2 domain-containing protein [Tannerella sp.]|nr:NPCBM/NEW2 domain-containing protein [Tannerella sp.]
MTRVYFLLLIAAWLSANCTAQMIEVELSSLDMEAFYSGAIKAGANLNIDGKPLSIAGTVYDKGVGTRAGGEVHIRLDGRKGRFTALAGVDDNARKGSGVIFYVFTNRGVAFSSDVIKYGDAPKPVDIDLKGVTDMYLVIAASAETTINYKGAYADWVNAKFEVQTPPIAVKDKPEAPYILTPPPAAVPRINGAKITGASAGKPFLFTIAATGERPMKFTAENLPEGLSLHAETGVITGVCNHQKAYRVPIAASNGAGTCRDTLEIVIGGGLAPTPHMGWNSWYIYQLGITQDIMERSAKALYDHGLVNFGYAYVNIDDGWEIKRNSDDPVIGGPLRHPDGTIRTNLNFPDMKKMTDYIHSLGLKAGLYSSPGPFTCGRYAGSFEHEEQDVKTFAQWGFDFLKYDWCTYQNRREAIDGPLDDLKKPYLLISKFLSEASRDIVLNMCQYGMGDVWKWGKDVGGHSWRTAGDLGHNTQELSTAMFNVGFFQEQIREYSGPNGWNDPDYLLFGNIWDWKNSKVVPSPFSPSEHYSCMTLWCMMAAPLIFSGEIIALDDFTKNVLCNAEVIDVNQDKLGKPGYSIYKRDFIEIWKKDLSDGNTAIAVFNRRPLSAKVKVDWKELGYEGKYMLRDLWRQKDLGTTSKVGSFDIPSHGCIMLKIVNTAPAAANTIDKRLTVERVAQWEKETGWLSGVNYIVSDAINSIAMFDKSSYNAELIDKELTLAEELGFNCIRVLVPYAVYADDPDWLLTTFDKFLSICSKHRITVMPTLFDDCTFDNNQPKAGKQPEPIIGWYSSYWSPSPGKQMVDDESSHPLLERYVKTFMERFKNDPRVAVWDVYNEPTGSKSSLVLVAKVFRWVREINPSQPITVGTWKEKLKDLNDLILNNSDIISFHCYGDANVMKTTIERLKAYNRPVVCTEWMHRPRKSTVANIMPILSEQQVGSFLWGLVNGKTQTHLTWGHRPEHLPYTGVWQCDLFHSDFKPYDEAELNIIRQVNGKLR